MLDEVDILTLSDDEIGEVDWESIDGGIRVEDEIYRQPDGLIDFGGRRQSLGLPAEIDPRVQIYTASNTLRDFHLAPVDTHLPNRLSVRGVRGPVGGGKTLGAQVMEWYLQAHRALPCADGVRRTRVTAVRNTYPELRSTTIQTFTDWFGPDIGYPQVRYDSPIEWRFTWEYPDAPPVFLQVYFLSMDKPRDIKKLKSLETTWLSLGEAVEIPFEVLEIGTGRAGRWPPPKMRPASCPPDYWPSAYGTIMETNSPSEDNWWYRLAELELPDGYRFWNQPGGLSPNAENIVNLPGNRKYYIDQIKGKSKPWIDAFVHNKYSTLVSGLPVWPEFNGEIHVSKTPLAILRNEPINLAFDFGGTPSCIAFQVSRRGQIRVLREWVTWYKQGTSPGLADADSGLYEFMGTKRFVKTVVKPAVDKLFKGLSIGIVVGDPAGVAKESNERSAISYVREHFPGVVHCWTNAWEMRRSSVAGRFDQLIDGMPNIIFDPSCRTLIRGCEGKYQLEKMQIAGAHDQFRAEPNKRDPHSHVCDTLQYACCEVDRKNLSDKAPEIRTRQVHDHAYGR